MNERELHALAAQQNVDRSTILHETREVAFLARIAADPVLATHLAFKGGTALRLVYLCDRYSDDLDFDLVKRAEPQDILWRLKRIAADTQWEITDAWVKRRTILLEAREPGWKRKLKIEVSSLPRPTVIPTVVRNIVTPVFPASVNILTYPLSVMLSGKMLAVLERMTPTPRDLYDLFWLLSRDVTEDRAYFAAAAKEVSTERGALYRSLLARVDDYSDRQIATELGALLPREQRRWASSALKERTKELLQLRLASMVT